MRLHNLTGAFLLTLPIYQSTAEDIDLFVASLPDEAQPNVLFIMDNSASMSAPFGEVSRIEAAKAAARDFVNDTQNNKINISLMSFYIRDGGQVDFASESIETGRSGAIAVINGYGASYSTPVGETYYEAYRYFAGLPPMFGAGRSVASSLNGSNYRSPIINSCQKNSIVIFSDGAPSNDVDANDNIRSLISGMTLPPGLSHYCTGNGGCMTEQAWYMLNNDIRGDFDGEQNIVTHTVGFTGAPSDLLTSIANFGGGQYYSAGNADQLNNALADIGLRVNATNATFASPATSTSAFNSLQTSEDVYFVVFKPSAGPDWTGNLKRYRLGEDNQIYDADGNLAIDPATGFFSDTARSFWSSDVDGSFVDAGGMAEHISRNRPVFTNISGSSNVTLSDGMNQLNETNPAITAAMLASPAPDADEREEILMWARGGDVGSRVNNGPPTQDRASIGDPIHTQPQVVTYYKNESISTVDKTVFFTTNDGFLHAVNADDGSTEFSFIPRDLLGNLKIYRDGYVGSSVNKIYGMDGPMTVWYNDVNGNGQILQSNNGPAEPGEHVYLYLTMRRGGNNIYALDVTDRSNPVLKWVIRGDLDNDSQADSSITNPYFSELGQTWSAPKLAQVKFDGTERKVLFFGGGYDVSVDNDNTIVSNDIGRAVYMVDAETGALLWWAGKSGADLILSDMNYSIPAELAVIDIDQNGNTDFIIAADTGGQLIRFDINQDNTGAGDFAQGGVIARLSGSGTANARRFFEAPDVVIGNNSRYLNISIGSGLRPHPLSEDVNDRMYVIRDPNVYTVPVDYGYDDGSVITESSLFDITDNAIQQGDSTQQAAAAASLGSGNGWMLRLEIPGEKVLSRTRVFQGVLLFNSFAPRQSATFTCGPQPGENYFYAVNIEDGSAVFNFDTVGSVTALNKSDRRQLLKLGTLAPEPSILSRGDQGAEICVGTECFQNTLQSLGSIPMNRNFWRENR